MATYGRFLIVAVAVAGILGTGCATGETQKKPLSKTERAILFVGVANGALAENDPTGALQNLAVAEAEDASLPALHHSKALAYFKKGDTISALKSVRRAVELAPDYPDANATLGKFLMDAGRMDEAEAALKKAAENRLYRGAYKALTGLGIIYYRKNQFDKSREYIDRAIADGGPLACVAYYYRGHLYLRESDFKQATRSYDHATRKFCGGMADAHLAMGITLEQNKQYDLARKKFVEIQQRFPETKTAEQAVNHLKYLP